MALGVVPRPVLVGPEIGAAVVVELGARAARAGGTGLPEVVPAPELDDALVGDPGRAPALDGLLVGTETELLVASEHGHPDTVLSQPEAACGQLERVPDGPLLEVVAEGEVAEHLEKGEVPSRGPHDLDVDRAKALLARREARMRRLLLAAEVRLERLHPRGREEHRGVVGRGDERRGRHAAMVVRFEERKEAFTYLRGRHAASVSPRYGPTGCSKARNSSTACGAQMSAIWADCCAHARVRRERATGWT